MITHWAGRAEAHVANLARIAIGSQVQAAGSDNARAQPRAQSKKNHVLAAHARAESMLRHRPRVGIILQPARRVESLSQLLADGHIHPGGKIGRRLDNSPHPIERAAAANPDARNRRLVIALLRQQGAHRFHDQAQSALRALLRQGCELNTPQAGRRMRRQDHRGLGTTHIHTHIDLAHA